MLTSVALFGLALAGPAGATEPAPPYDSPLVEALTDPQNAEQVTPAELGLPDPGDPRLEDGITVSSEPSVLEGFLSPRLRSPGATTRRSTLAAVACSGKINNPHYSEGAGGAIAKIRVTCTGSGYPSVNVRVRGLLSFSPTSYQTLQPRGTLDDTKAVFVNGGEVTYYLSPIGSHGGTGNGYWAVTATIQITAPAVGSVGSETKFYYLNINRPGVS